MMTAEQKKSAFLIAQNSLAVSMFGKSYDELNDWEKVSIDEMCYEVSDMLAE